MGVKPNVEIDGDLTAPLREALARLPDLRLEKEAVLYGSTREGQLLDAELKVQAAGRPVRLLVQTRRSCTARDLREAVQRLRPLRDLTADIPAIPLIAAPRIPTRGREYLREQGLGYWDLGESLYFKVPWAVYFIDRPPLPSGPRKRREVFQGRTTQVLHSLLLDPERPWHLNELAALSETSSYIALQTCAYLEEQLWMEREGKGPNVVRYLREPGAVLDAWAQAYSLERYRFRRYHRWTQSPAALREAVGAALEETGVDYALTLAAGAELAAPFATSVERLTIIIPENAPLQAVGDAAKLRPVDDGENIAFLVTRERSPLLFRQRLRDTWVASNVQLYLDLFAWPQRGREQAQHLRSERLPY
jgi:hypothetical protein